MCITINQWLMTFLNKENFFKVEDFPERFICQNSFYGIKDVSKCIYSLLITVAYTFRNFEQYLFM